MAIIISFVPIGRSSMEHSKIHLLVLGLICAGALMVRLEGIAWPRLHPDEPVIGAWIDKAAQSAYVRDRVYPNGFFVLARPFAWINRAFAGLEQKIAYWCGNADRVLRTRIDGVLLGRLLNAAAGAAVCVFIYLFVARIMESPRGGLCAAILAAFCQYAVEHSHYAETDIAALLMLSVTFWLWGLAGKTAKPRLFALAALAGGFAAGTKFTLLILAPIVLVEAVITARRQYAPGWWRTSAGLALMGLALFVAGFVIANPALILKFNWFHESLAAEQKRVFAETALNLGAAGAQPGVKCLHHVKLLVYHLNTLGYPWLILIALGAPLTMFSPARRYWPTLLLFPLLYVFYWVFLAPWVRSQEFLLFIPSLAAVAIIPLVGLWRSRLIETRALALLFAAAAIITSSANGVRVAGLFGWKDTRPMANEWLQIRMPPDGRLAVESYAEAACPPVINPPRNIRKVERDGVKQLAEGGSEYLLRAATISGRGLRHPLSGKLYPGAADKLREFDETSTLLCAWAPLPVRPPAALGAQRLRAGSAIRRGEIAGGPPQGQATFVSPVIELYGLKKFTPRISMRAELPRPALIVNSDRNRVGRWTFCPVGSGLGCADALLVDSQPQTIAIGGPPQLTGPVYLVLNTFARPAVIHVRGFGLRRRVALAPYDTAVVPLQRSVWRPTVMPFENITLAAEPAEDVLYIPCFARIAWTVSEAARICLETARADKIPEYFPEELLKRELTPDLRAILEARLGRADGARETAGLRERIKQCLQLEKQTVAINGLNGYYYDQFARARLQAPADLASGPQAEEYVRSPLPAAVKILDLQLPEDEQEVAAGAAQLYSQAFAVPALVARGRYELRSEMMLTLNEPAAKSAVALKTLVSAGTESAGSMDMQSGQWREFRFTLQPGREVQPHIVFSLPVAGRVYLRNMEIIWTFASALEALGAELSAGASGREDGKTAGKAPEIKNAVKNPPIFTPWCKLAGFAFNAQTRQVTCVFEALRDDTPKLAVNFSLLRRGEWRRKQAQALGAKTWLKKGECETVTIRLDDAFGANPDMNKIGLGVETDVLWHPGSIPLQDGRRVIAFAALLAE